jgi:hypothetical protein
MAVAVRSRTRTTTDRSRSAHDVLALLKHDHKEVGDIFDRVEALGDRALAQRRRLGEQICEALEIHSKFEQEDFYPRFRERAEEHEEREKILEAFEEHSIVDRLVQELRGMDAKDDRYEAKLMVLIESVRHHIKEEEREMFPTARKLFQKDELAQLGQQFLEAKRRAGMPAR